MKKLITLCLTIVSLNPGKCQDEWWRTMSLYQVYPRSYKDYDGDGIGDLKGVASRLDHLIDSNIDAFWLSPIYPSPNVDFGYDISNFIDIDPIYGSLDDFDELVKTSHDKGLKIVIDFVPNHSSDQHEWFQKSINMIEPYSDYYVWHKGRVLDNGTVTVPNNWVSVFGGSAWAWNEQRQAYYLHQFSTQQPDFNFYSEELVEEMKNVFRFWLDRGIDGVRIDSAPYLVEDNRFLDEPLSGTTNNPNAPDYTAKVYTKDQQGNYDVVRGWSDVLEEYRAKDGFPRVMMAEAYANLSSTIKYYNYGVSYPFNFGFIIDVNANSNASDFKNVIDSWMSQMPSGSTANWVAGNHDNPRLASRFGEKRAPSVTMMVLLLPGVGVTYNGEEIGMVDTWISWEDTIDTEGCSAGRDGYEKASRDPERTPFQWDNTTSAGFSTNPKTWLPMNSNYKTLNLAAEKEEKDSYFTMYKAVSSLRKSPAARKGDLTTKLLGDNVLAIVRGTQKDGSIYLIINFEDREETVDLSTLDNISEPLRLYYATRNSGLDIGSTIKDIKKLIIPPSAGLIYVSN